MPQISLYSNPPLTLLSMVVARPSRACNPSEKVRENSKSELLEPQMPHPSVYPDANTEELRRAAEEARKLAALREQRRNDATCMVQEAAVFSASAENQSGNRGERI
jgi:hypothetical protein